MKMNMTEEQMNQARSEYARRVANVTHDDVEDVLRKQEKAESTVCSVGVLQQYWETVTTFFSLIGDYYNGSYRKVPFGTIAAIVGSLAYLLSPIDAIPDFIPVVGYLDDAGVLALCLKLVNHDLEIYRAWKAQQRHSARLIKCDLNH